MGILFFNWYGYQLLSNYWQDRAESRLEASLDKNNYDESTLISFKIPLTSLAYYNSSTGFERVSGRIEISGVSYQYVKRRIFKDSLEVLCIPNMDGMKLRSAQNDFFRQVNDLQQQNQGKKNNASPVKNNSKDYRPAMTDVIVPDALAFNIAPVRGLKSPARIPSRYLPTAENPPEQI